MMMGRRYLITCLIVCLIAFAMNTSAFAQGLAIPTAPAIPAAPAAPAIPATPATPAAPSNIWSKILPTPEQKAACKKHLCESGLVQFFGVMLKPVTFATGGLIKPCCPDPNDARPEDLAKPADSADGAAARIKEDEAQAKQRRANVRYLGTVDCARYPEAEMALINALRTDRNECVRLEAAIVLGHGCCCTKKVVEALKLTVTGSDKDGNPKETSSRVRAAAEASLASCQVESNPEPPEPVPPGAEPKNEPKEMVRIKPRLRPVPMSNEIQPVQATAPLTAPPTATPTTGQPAVAATPVRVPTGQRGLFDLLKRSFAEEPPR